MSPQILIAIISIAALIGGAGAWTVQGWRYGAKEAVFAAAIDKQKLTAQGLLASETERVRVSERALADFKNSQEITDADNQKIVALRTAVLLRAATVAGRLRDPNAAGCGRSGNSPQETTSADPGPGANDAAEAGGLLSRPVTDLLERLTAEADDINLAYISCRADAEAVRK